MLGNLKVNLRDEFGNLRAMREIDNVFTDVGDAHVADQMASTPGEAAMSHMAVGTDTTTLTAGDTTLGGETDRNALTSFTQGTAGDDNKVVYVGDWAAADATAALTEAGIFNSSTAGSMLCASTFSVINKGAADTLQITYSIASYYRKVIMKLRKFGEHLSETIPSQAEVIKSLWACVETRDEATHNWVERIVRTMWRHIEISRNDLFASLEVATNLGL